MNKVAAINTAVGCVMASGMEPEEKRKVIKSLRDLEQENRELRESLNWILDTEDQFYTRVTDAGLRMIARELEPYADSLQSIFRTARTTLEEVERR